MKTLELYFFRDKYEHLQVSNKHPIAAKEEDCNSFTVYEGDLCNDICEDGANLFGVPKIKCDELIKVTLNIEKVEIGKNEVKFKKIKLT